MVEWRWWWGAVTSELQPLTCAQVHIEFTDGEERISLEGPTEEVEQAQAQIQEIINDLVRGTGAVFCDTGKYKQFVTCQTLQ